MARKTYEGFLNSLPPNGIFVFGSNTQGVHGAGAALTAYEKFGAELGNPKGLQGRSYAIITKDLQASTHPSIGMYAIEVQIAELYKFARENPDKDFYVAYSGNGANLNEYSNKEMAGMFVPHWGWAKDRNVFIPENIIFEENFLTLIENIIQGILPTDQSL